ncbi:MAG TPA: LacI family DNA-binding transcriptional regulator, partial [Trueperaceae bacterium]|nr:LacI family DNA-binding transcriptional regulator [Trueperaceae bacterium]
MGVKGRSSGGQDRVEDAGGEPKGDRGEDTASAGAAGRAERVGVEAAGRAVRVGAGDRAPQAPGRRVTIKDVAAALGVAQSTVSNAYNRPDQLSAELRERVLATAEAMG